MRSLWVIVLVVITALGVTSVASASMRDEVRALIDSAATLTADGGEVIPDEPAPEPGDGDEADVDDGQANRADKEPSGDGTCTATRAQNGNTWRIGEPQYQNHGAAVSAVAKSQAGKTDKSAD